MKKLRVLDLFSGIGGFSLGLERTGGFETVAFCEIEEFPRKVLAKHWPEVPIYEDVRQLHGMLGSVDVICGGFPCQPYSTASSGKRKGAADDRALWPEMLRLIRQVRPAWVIGENVAGIASMDLERVVSDLEAIGYSQQPLDIPAGAVGHDHRRARFWFIGHTDRDGKSIRAEYGEASRLFYRGSQRKRLGKADGLSRKLDADRNRMKALGNAVVPQIPEMIGRAILEAEAARQS